MTFETNLEGIPAADPTIGIPLLLPVAPWLLREARILLREFSYLVDPFLCSDLLSLALIDCLLYLFLTICPSLRILGRLLSYMQGAACDGLRLNWFCKEVYV